MTNIVVTEEETGTRNLLVFQALCDGGSYCGQIDLYRSKKRIGGRTTWEINSVYVPEARRRQGVATKLYETAAQAACDRRGHLASTYRSPGAHSHDFWAKQLAKGRARMVRRRDSPQPAYILTSCPVGSLARPARRRRR